MVYYNCQTHSLLPLTAGPVKGWKCFDQTDSNNPLLEGKKEKAYHNAINHARASRFSWCHGQLQKARLIKFSSFCTELAVKSLKIWSGTGVDSRCSKHTSDCFAWPLKTTERPTWVNLCVFFFFFCFSLFFSFFFFKRCILLRNKLIRPNYRCWIVKPFIFSAQFQQKLESVTNYSDSHS